MKNKRILFTTCILLLIAFIAIGCTTPAKRPVPEPRTTPSNETIDRNRTTTDNKIRTTDEMLPNDNRNTMDNRMNNDLSDRADRIKNQVSKLKDVKSATVVITERTALVGINLTSGTKGELNSKIKKDVEDTVKKADKDIERVAVTSDPDIFTRIENIGKDIGQGRPISGFATEVEEIIRRIVPGA